MDKQKLTTTAASGLSTKAITTNHAAVLSQPIRRVLQSFLLVWLDANFDESNDHYNKSIQDLQHIVATITTFTDVDQCVDFLSDIEDEKVLMIVSDALGQHIVPEIQALPQLHSIYVFCDNQLINQQWATTIPKIKGVYTQIEPICEALKIDCEHCDRGMISVSFNRIDPLFMYTQLLKEALLEIEDDDAKSIKELVEYCRLHSDASEVTLEKIEREYRDHTPIWWYTGPYFIYSMLNHGLRQMDVDVILKMGFFIRHLHQHITDLHREQQNSTAAMPSKFQVFRGQGLSMEAFEKIKKTKGGLMSFNNFLSTSRNPLPPNHPDLAASYNNIGSVYNSMGEYSKALSSYERSLEITKIALPPNHPDLAASYNNIGLVYYDMGEYSKALSSQERSLEIRKIAVPPNHPDLATSYNNIENDKDSSIISNTNEDTKVNFERLLSTTLFSIKSVVSLISTQDLLKNLEEILNYFKSTFNVQKSSRYASSINSDQSMGI
ncbi:unnamed protein product [Rotaria sordida]|uniref:Kinesin light chain n=1 Tax=Rotaria sordida TaxID=392033 RepID=A0A815KL50_9BILA|nr:unnamed protein product [Rotaria sordida]CAF1622826.1 unnamed protein product [Rotaria sordida]